MSEIPDPVNHTVDRIYDALAQRAKGGDSAGVPMSDAINPCDRAIWYAFRWASPPETPNGPRESRFATGEAWETRLLDDLQAIGCDVERVDPATGKQRSAVLADGYLRGKLDGLVRGVPEAPAALHVVEARSLKAEKWRGVVKHGVQKHIPEHFAQCQLYMSARGVDRCLYLCVNKDTDERHAERLYADPAFASAIEARIVRIVNCAEPPSRLHDDPAAKAAWQCGLCRHRAICHEKAFARVNCRTCLHSTVWTPWKCDKLNLLMTWDSQQAGCEHHRYIPALVPGEQIDVIYGDCIVYQMEDGDHWIDGERQAA